MNNSERTRVRMRRGRAPENDIAAARPSLSRIYQVAAGLATWTLEEEGWVKQNPKWSEYMRRMRNAITEVEARAQRAL